GPTHASPIGVTRRHATNGWLGQHLLRQADLLGLGGSDLLLAEQLPPTEFAEVLGEFGQELFEAAHGRGLSLIVNLLPGSPAPGLPVPGRGFPTSPGWSRLSVMAGSARGPYLIWV